MFVLLTALLCGTMLVGLAIETYSDLKQKRIAADLQTLELRVRLAEAEAKKREARP